MIELEDCGKDILLNFPVILNATRQVERTIIMTIKAPKGVMALFSNDPEWTTYKQCEAIGAFMEEHKDD